MNLKKFKYLPSYICTVELDEFLQVETVGDKYMAVSGLPEPCNTHARCIAKLALDIMDLSREVLDDDGVPIVSNIIM